MSWQMLALILFACFPCKNITFNKDLAINHLKRDIAIFEGAICNFAINCNSVDEKKKKTNGESGKKMT